MAISTLSENIVIRQEETTSAMYYCMLIININILLLIPPRFPPFVMLFYIASQKGHMIYCHNCAHSLLSNSFIEMCRTKLDSHYFYYDQWVDTSAGGLVIL